MPLVLNFALEKKTVYLLIMKRTVIYLLFLSVILFSCKPNKRALIMGKWNAVNMENPSLDSFFKKSQQYIDTIGSTHDSATNVATYGSNNMDSMRQLLQLQLDSAKNMQEDAVVKTQFNFRKDNIVILAFNGNTDSSKWFIDSKDNLVLTDLNNAGGAADNLKMEILSINDSVLKLKFAQNNIFSTVTFRHEGK